MAMVHTMGQGEQHGRQADSHQNLASGQPRSQLHGALGCRVQSGVVLEDCIFLKTLAGRLESARPALCRSVHCTCAGGEVAVPCREGVSRDTAGKPAGIVQEEIGTGMCTRPTATLRMLSAHVRLFSRR